MDRDEIMAQEHVSSYKYKWMKDYAICKYFIEHRYWHCIKNQELNECYRLVYK